MKKIFLCCCLFFTGFSLLAQKQANIWYFGNKGGLDFNRVPPQVLNNGKANTVEGSSTVSDNNGNLLFYTNGNVIMNRLHLQMKNGGLLAGDRSSTNNTLIVPLPGNDSLYYVFTTGAALQETHQFQYNIVNIKGDGGLGEVIVQNVLIEDIIFEKLAGVRHCNNKDVWVVVHKWESDEYHAYLLSSTGLNLTPVISATGLIISGGYENNMIGTLKFSPRGTRLAAIHSFQNDVVELMDFNNSTGVLSNPVVFKPNTIVHPTSFIGVYGAEFSPNGNLLYVSANNSITDPSTLYQFDITSGNAATIISTKQIISQTTPWFAGALQMAPDLKIYMAHWQDTSISVIENPDVYGPGCNFRYNKIYMGTVPVQPVQYGLPTFISNYFDTTANPYDFTRSGDCSNHNVSFSINRVSGIDSVKWNFGDGNTSQALAASNNYINPGFYDVQLIVYKVDCSGLYDTITRRIWITDNKNFLGSDASSCSSLQLTLGIDDIEGANYLWSTGEVSNKIVSTGTGWYWMDIQQNGCIIRDSVNIFLKPAPSVSLGPDTSVCFNQGALLYAGTGLADSYLWNTGETTPSIFVKAIGEYSVTVTVDGCIAADTVNVNWGDCEVFIPSAFTPNNDRWNNSFGIATPTGFIATSFLLQIFDRRGQIVFKTTDMSQKWDGTFKKANMPMGAYVWILNYVDSHNKRRAMNGTVMLIR